MIGTARLETRPVGRVVVSDPKSYVKTALGEDLSTNKCWGRGSDSHCVHHQSSSMSNHGVQEASLLKHLVFIQKGVIDE